MFVKAVQLQFLTKILTIDKQFALKTLRTLKTIFSSSTGYTASTKKKLHQRLFERNTDTVPTVPCCLAYIVPI